MIILNGVSIETIEALELEMTAASLSEEQKQILRNQFNGIENPPVAAINPVTNQQLRTALVLTSFGQNKPHLHPEAIKAYLETLSEPTRSLALQQWEYSNEMIRNNPFVDSMATSLGLASAEADALWIYASTL